MGIYPSADLIWGIVVEANAEGCDGEYGPTPWYDESKGFRLPFESSRVEIVTVGHYEDPDPKAIITIKGTPRWSGDAWDYPSISPADMTIREKDIAKASDEMAAEGFPLDFRDAEWRLIGGLG